MPPSQKRRRRVERALDARMLGFLKPTALSGGVTHRPPRDGLEFLKPAPPAPPTAPPAASIDQAS